MRQVCIRVHVRSCARWREKAPDRIVRSKAALAPNLARPASGRGRGPASTLALAAGTRRGSSQPGDALSIARRASHRRAAAAGSPGSPFRVSPSRRPESRGRAGRGGGGRGVPPRPPHPGGRPGGGLLRVPAGVSGAHRERRAAPGGRRRGVGDA